MAYLSVSGRTQASELQTATLANPTVNIIYIQSH